MPQNNSNQGPLSEALLKAKQERFITLCYNVFQLNKDGKELLFLLKESLIDKTPVADPTKSESHAYFREGQNNIIRSLYANIELAETLAKQN